MGGTAPRKNLLPSRRKKGGKGKEKGAFLDGGGRKKVSLGSNFALFAPEIPPSGCAQSGREKKGITSPERVVHGGTQGLRRKHPVRAKKGGKDSRKVRAILQYEKRFFSSLAGRKPGGKK